MKGTDIDAAARGILQDEAPVAFTPANMLIWINQAQDEIVIHAPRSNMLVENIDLAAMQNIQSVPEEFLSLVDITRNMGVGGATPGKSISRTTLDRLQASRPAWSSDKGRSVRHFMIDERDNRTFYVWPQPSEVISIEARVVGRPVPITALANDLTLADIWKNAHVEYVLHKAHSQQSDSAANTEASMLHYQAFARLVGLKLDKERRTSAGANSTSNPAYPNVEKNGALEK